MAANNVVEIIIRAITTGNEQKIKKTETALDRLNKTAHKLGQGLKTTAATIGIAVAALYVMARAIQWVGEQAERLGQRGAAKAVKELGDQFRELGDQLLTISIGGGNNIFTIIEAGANGLVTSLRAVGVVIELVALAFRVWVIEMTRAYGMLQQLQGKSTEFTQAWRDQQVAIELQTTAVKIGVIWEGKYTEALQKTAMAQKAMRQGNLRTAVSLDTLIKANHALNNEYDKRKTIEDAIRAGDARALASAMYGGGGGSSGGGGGGVRGTGPTANGGAGNRSMNTGSGKPIINVTVKIGSETIDRRVRKTIAGEMFRPAVESGGEKKGVKKVK